MGDSSDDDHDPSTKFTRRLVDAYKRASSTSDAVDEFNCLKAAGVILPNGLTPYEPLHSEEGEWLSGIFGQGEALVKEGRIKLIN